MITQTVHFSDRLKKITLLNIITVTLCFGQYVWEPVNPYSTKGELKAVTNGNNLFVAVGTSGVILTSKNGYQWAPESSGTKNTLSSVTWGNGKFVSIGEYGTILSSPDGATWKAESSGISTELLSVAYGRDLFMTVGRQVEVNIGTVLTSPDGATWTRKKVPTGAKLTAVIYAGNKFVVVGEGGVIIYSADDGTTWSRVDETLYSFSFRSQSTVAYGNNRFLVISQADDSYVSSNCNSWSMHKTGIPNVIYCSIYGNGQFVAVGSWGVIISSPDGATWTQRTSMASYGASSLYGVTYANDMFVAVGDTILVSQKDTTTSIGCIAGERARRSLKAYMRDGIMHIPWSSATNVQRVEIELLTLAGKSVYRASIQPERNTIRIPLNGVAAGIYLLSVTGGKLPSESLHCLVASEFH